MKIEEVVSIEGIYESESTLTLLSVPLAIWTLLPDHAACRYIGKIKSKNLCQVSSVQHLFAQALDSSKASPIVAEQSEPLYTQQTHLLKEISGMSTMNRTKIKDSSEDIVASKETMDLPESPQEAGSSFVDEARASVRADYRGDSPFNEDHRRENFRTQRKLSSPEMPPTPPESVCGDFPAIDK
jgi:hypothetical protein